MNHLTPPRPAAVSVIAWLWIAAGTLIIVAGAMGAFVYWTEERHATLDASLAQEFAFMDFVNRNFHLLIMLQSTFALAALWGGFALLRLKAWARIVVETLCWIALAYCVGIGVYFWRLASSPPPNIPESATRSNVSSFDVSGLIMMVIVIGAIVTPLGLMIWYLRRKDVRNCF
jgi:hypothetical protein